MSEISTAEQFLTHDMFFRIPLTEKEKKIFIEDVMTIEDIKLRMIEFAKLHVKAALKAATENATAYVEAEEDDNDAIVDIIVHRDSILNAYPETNIK